jgi:hypothetical protein
VGIKSGKCREEVARLDWLAATGTREHTLALTAGTLKHQRWTINSPCHTSVPEFPHTILQLKPASANRCQ